MLLVRLPAGQLGPDDRDQGTARVGNVVDSVGEGYYAIVTVAEDVSCIYPGDTLIIV